MVSLRRSVLESTTRETRTLMTDPAAALATASSRFAELAASGVPNPSHKHHEVGAAILTLCSALDRAEAAGLSQDPLRELIAVAREVHALSPFVRRLQTWSRGYQGDFETIEHLLSQENQAEPGTVGFVIEQYCLATALAQQHRNKMQRQTNEIMKVLLREDQSKAPSVLILAAGSTPELRYAANFVQTRDFRVVLCDTDPGAIDFSTKALASLGDRVRTLEGDVVWCAESIEEQGPYDLIVAGGLFDYLDDKWAKKTLSLVLGGWLAPGGKLFFTNLATENPFRLWMRCVVNWTVIERTEQDLVELVSSARTSNVAVQVGRDPTTLALLAEVRLVAS